ncbi:MAG: PQQ-binding-like beta-propeller repeat protein [Candidatus Eremiobacteraeota bacterium]|nr:PQQ-binding-like beta-propeller repeat protein [Candidatus Eremiobacteraeota bacterium]
MKRREPEDVFRIGIIVIGMFVIFALGLKIFAGGAQATSMAGTITITPAFSASQLAASPTDNWVTNGGSLSNQRYSPLTEINASNIGSLKGLWLTHLRGSAIAAKYSAESQPLEYQGVIYVSTGMDDVFAVDADSGKILWQYQAHLNQQISTTCCGWMSRGVALGAGKVYIGQLDGKLVALDQHSGNVVWSTLVARWQDGYTVTSAPLYVDGMVITGVAGGEYGIRGRLTAFNAQTGREAWRFYTIPGPGETGHNTWPQTGNAWTRGGAPIWQTPSVDPKLGLIYFSTGNASPDNRGDQRAGKNLFSASMVALDLKSGKLRWYYQMVHHDLWDYDAPSPTVLFDATIHGKLVHGIGEAQKTGWLYLLDRTNGEPIYPIPERPVPQEARQQTWPTQPFPTTDEFVPHRLNGDQIAAVKKVAAEDAGDPVPVILSKGPFTPYWKEMTVITPGNAGGTNWPPSSYSPSTHMFYVCAQAEAEGVTADTVELPKASDVGTEYNGSVRTAGNGFGKNTGTFSAMDVTTGKIVWQKVWPGDSCFSGSVVTAGNVVFVGRNRGQLQAYNATNGNLVWNFQTGAGANNTPAIFQRNGHEEVAFYAGGNALAVTPHGDNLWVFSLDGKLGPAPSPGPGQGIEHIGGAGPKKGAAAAGPPNAANGASVFSANCSACHGATGHGGNGGPNLTVIPSAKNMQRVVQQVTNGGPGMPAFSGTLTAQQIQDVSAYVIKNITNKP